MSNASPDSVASRRRRSRRVATAAALAAAAAMSLATAGPAAATDGSPCARPQVYRANHWVQYCPLWRSNVPVYADPDHGNGAAIVGRLVVGGSANWFVGDHYRSYFSDGGYYNHWWAYTLADNGRWGWVPEVYFSGGNNDETDGGLYLCEAGPNLNHCS